MALESLEVSFRGMRSDSFLQQAFVSQAGKPLASELLWKLMPGPFITYAYAACQHRDKEPLSVRSSWESNRAINRRLSLNRYIYIYICFHSDCCALA